MLMRHPFGQYPRDSKKGLGREMDGGTHGSGLVGGLNAFHE